ncbi:hypothetical protein DL770_005520 [Monosporascus sp. CRB-9-2]|nr:hypothetical protein DL770_005520 [Monosporascus sp. CRB-9-2]
MDSSSQGASGSHETAVGGEIVQGTQDTATAQGGLSRLLRLRTTGIGSGRARKSSIDSLDRVFDTRADSKDPHVVPLQRVLTAEEEHIAKNSCGVAELRDSFFDAVFFPPEEVDTDELLKRAEATLPYAFRKKDPLSVTNFLPKQWHEVQSVVQRVTTTRAGIKLLKSFLGFFIAYIICLIPQIQSWLGQYSHVMVVSAIINHSGRTLGAHVDGVIITTIGTGTGLGWGAIGLLLSTVSSAARLDYGAILSTFLFVIALVICAIVAPDAGARPLAVALHQAFEVMLDGLDVNGPDIVRTRRRLAQTFVNLSQAYRDLVIDFSITLFRPQDVRVLRNRTQGVVRTILSLKRGTRVFEVAEASDMNVAFGRRAVSDDFVVGIDKRSRTKEVAGEWEVMRFVASALAEPTEDLLSAMRQYLGPPAEVPADVSGSLVNLRKCIITFSSCQDNVLASDKLPPTYADFPEKIKSRDFQPLPREGYAADNTNASYATMTATELEDEPTAKSRFRQDLWSVVHRMQGFETRFGLKTALVTSLLAIPAWFVQDATWWNEFEIWWAVRSGLVGCLSFTLVSIAEYNAGGIVSKYVYYESGDEPTKEDIEASEALEGCLREGFVRLRQLLVNPPVSTPLAGCEQFFEYVVTLRQSSLFYHPHFVRDNAEAAAELLGHRRDAIATILTNLYVLSGALRADRKVPKYLPSAAATRKRLLDRTKQLEAELAASGKLTATEKTESKKWAQIYSYSYNESLTGCVEQLLELERYTKAVVGEQG